MCSWLSPEQRFSQLGKYQLSELIYHATLTHAWGLAHGYFFNTVSWSISAELGAYLLFLALWFVIGNRRWTGLLAVVAIYTFSIIFAHALCHMTLPILSWNFGGLRALAGSSLGLWLYAHLPETAQVAFTRDRFVVLFQLTGLDCRDGLLAE